MTITRADVADLRAGDVVRLDCNEQPGTVITGPVYLVGNRLQVGTYIIRTEEGGQFYPFGADRTLTVISRAKPPLYVNSDKTQPDPGDVATAAESGPNHGETWHFLDAIGHEWFDKRGYARSRDELPGRLRLLVDGRTGQTVPTVMERG